MSTLFKDNQISNSIIYFSFVQAVYNGSTKMSVWHAEEEEWWEEEEEEEEWWEEEEEEEEWEEEW